MFDVICEIGVNHENSLEKALNMIKDIGSIDTKGLVKISAKFQFYKAEKLASKISPAYWDITQEKTTSQRELFKKFDKFSINDYKLLSKECDNQNIEFMATAFDEESLQAIDPLVSRHKIASADLTNIPLVREVAKLQKPIILSTGASNEEEIRNTCKEIRILNPYPITLLHCVLLYPTPDNKANLIYIDELRDKFPNTKVGYSDHTVPDKNLSIIKLAFSKDIVTLEKHYTFNKKLKGNDHYHSIDISDLQNLIKFLDWYKLALGNKGLDDRSNEEKAIKHARRSIVSKVPLKKGSILTSDVITTKRPAHGIPSIEWDNIIGKTLNQDLKADTSLSWSMILDH